MHYRVDTLANQAHYQQAVKTLNTKSWPKFLLYGDSPSWDRLYDVLSDCLLLLIAQDGALAGAGFTIPVSWNGSVENLPPSIEAIIVNGLENRSRSANTLMAVAALVDSRYRGQHLSREILKQMAAFARTTGLDDLLVPVRPTWKARYPLQRIAHYARWRRADGLLYDPWLRTHERLGARVLTCVENTYQVNGSIDDWQTWTGMVFPESGAYIVDGALRPVEIDVASDIGVYRDPNVWMHHALP